jgi:hypothetical protein
MQGRGFTLESSAEESQNTIEVLNNRSISSGKKTPGQYSGGQHENNPRVQLEDLFLCF